MKSRTSFFNAEIFKKTVIRFWPLWFAYLAVWLFALPFMLGINAENMSEYQTAEYIRRDLWYYTLEVGHVGGLIAGYVTAIFAAMAVWSFAYNSRSASGYASLPVRREAMFASLSLAGIVPVVALNLVIVFVTLIVQLFAGVVNVLSLVQWFGTVTLIYVFFYGFATFCAQLTGNIGVLPAVFTIFNFVAIFVEMIVKYMMELIVYGYRNDEVYALKAFSPTVMMADRVGPNSMQVYDQATDRYIDVSQFHVEGVWILIVYALIGLVFAALALLIYRRRAMESAGDVVAVKVLKPVFKYCMTFGCALVLGAIITAVFESIFYAATLGVVAGIIVVMFIGGAIGYYASEMLMKKSFKVFRGSLKQLVICFAIIALGMLTLELDIFGIERRVPNAEQVTTVRVSGGGTNCYLEEPENIEAAIELHESIINNKSLYEQDVNRRGYNTTVRVIYTLENGDKLSRSYRMRSGEYYTHDGWKEGDIPEDLYTLQDLGNCREAILDRKKLNIPVALDTIIYANVITYNPSDNTEYTYELTKEEAWELYRECVVPDIEEQKLGRIWVVTDDSYYNTVCDAHINIDLYSREGVMVEDGHYITYDDSFSTTVTFDAERTVRWLESHGIELFPVGQRGEYYEKYYYEGYDGPIAVTEDIEINYVTVPADKRENIE